MIENGNSIALEPNLILKPEQQKKLQSLITDLLTSTYTDIDSPNAALYPKGMLGFNLRRSGYNVARFKKDYFTHTTS